VLGLAPTLTFNIEIDVPVGGVVIEALLPAYIGPTIYPQAVNMNVAYVQAAADSGYTYIRIRGKLGMFGPPG